MAALLGLLTATTLAVSGAGLLSTGDLTVLGWGPFVAAALVVLGPPTSGLLRHRRTSHRLTAGGDGVSDERSRRGAG